MVSTADLSGKIATRREPAISFSPVEPVCDTNSNDHEQAAAIAAHEFAGYRIATLGLAGRRRRIEPRRVMIYRAF